MIASRLYGTFAVIFLDYNLEVYYYLIPSLRGLTITGVEKNYVVGIYGYTYVIDRNLPKIDLIG